MINGKRVLGLIPARGGSKGIKNKNICDLAGKPLIAYTIEAAINSGIIDYVMVTTDSGMIADVAKQYGAQVPFIRPSIYAQDKSTTLSAVLHAIKTLAEQNQSFDILVLLQPTSPLRNAYDIRNAIECFIENKSQALVTVSEVKKHPLLIRSISNEGRLVSLLNQSSTVRRQDMPCFYEVNGAIYINNISEINEQTSFNDNKIPYVMDSEHSVDIDEYADLLYANTLLQYRKKDTNINKDSMLM